MSLAKLKKKLAVDQRNLIRGEVTEVKDATASVRLSDGRTITCGLSGLQAVPGDLVQVLTEGTTYTIDRTAPLAQLDGKRVVVMNYGGDYEYGSGFSADFDT